LRLRLRRRRERHVERRDLAAIFPGQEVVHMHGLRERGAVRFVLGRKPLPDWLKKRLQDPNYISDKVLDGVARRLMEYFEIT
jgi:hypothetical protein